MDIPSELVGLACASFAALQAWTLREVVSLKTAVSAISAKCEVCGPKPASPAAAVGVVLLAGLFLLASGCAGPERALYDRAPVAVTNSLPLFTTTTNSAGGVVITPAGQTNWVSTNTVWTVKTNIVSITETIGVLNQAVPSPAQPAIAGALALAAGLLGLWGRYRSGQATAAESTLEATIRGVELAGDLQTKKSIRAVARAKGVESHLAGRVQKLTAPDRACPEP